MTPRTQKLSIAGPAGVLETALDEPEAATARGVAVLCHPHPLHGGTMDHKVVQTMARACVAIGLRAVRFNYRGVGGSAGEWGGGTGEIDDALAVIAAQRDALSPLVLGGFSFGGYVAASAATRLAAPPAGLVLVAPAVQTFPVGPVPPATLVIHGEADDVVPLAAVLDWARPQRLPVVVLPGVGHFFHGQLPRLKELVMRGALR
jgi:alpha/beta superfamily hydrolase